jgi:hypothetical protein
VPAAIMTGSTLDSGIELAGRNAAVGDELPGLLDDRVSLAEKYGLLVLTLIIVVLMVFKP